MKKNVYLISLYGGVLVGASLPSLGISLSWPRYVTAAAPGHQGSSSPSFDARGDAQELRRIPITPPELSNTEQRSTDIVEEQNARRSSLSSQRQLGKEKAKASTAPRTP